jgi:hypothetical protein
MNFALGYICFYHVVVLVGVCYGVLLQHAGRRSRFMTASCSRASTSAVSNRCSLLYFYFRHAFAFCLAFSNALPWMLVAVTRRTVLLQAYYSTTEHAGCPKLFQTTIYLPSNSGVNEVRQTRQ